MTVSFCIEKIEATKQRFPTIGPLPFGPTLPTFPLLLWLNCLYSKRKVNPPSVLCIPGPLTFSRTLLLNLLFPVSAILFSLSTGPLNHTHVFVSPVLKKKLTSLISHFLVAPVPFVCSPLQQEDLFVVLTSVSP